jgi:hypothetical protein
MIICLNLVDVEQQSWQSWWMMDAPTPMRRHQTSRTSSIENRKASEIWLIWNQNWLDFDQGVRILTQIRPILTKK